MEKKIIVGADPFGFGIKEAVKEHLKKRGFEVRDVGTLSPEMPVEYYTAGYQVAKAVADGEYERGIVFCGSGMGVNLIANKFPGVYCGLVESVYTASLCRTINNCNMLALGGFLNGEEKARKMVDAFLDTPFAPAQGELDSCFLQCSYEQVRALEKKIRSEYALK
ncbi:RpiB/LacA/LacB family sugar-phosphate isomerase [Diplocloster hominis]|uniref:RpiB/LacA/LacB family sugar-phosphate isomerase n=1 Tax=Diplocloster hominis TaxID=3079010 RepID=UPI0031BB326C